MVNKVHPKLEERVEKENWTEGIERPLTLLDIVTEQPGKTAELAGHSIISSRQFEREQIIQLCRLAAKFETQQSFGQFPLTGKILISAFYEPSTRTRLSFESVWHRLGGDIISITDPSTTGIAKGESLSDVAEMMNHYGDVVVLRDSNNNAIYEMLEGLRIPIINAGNGTDEHPTQALADMYAIFKWRPELLMEDVPEEKKVRIAIIGNPRRMRTVRSLLLLFSQFSDVICEVVIICNRDTGFDEGQKEELENEGLNIRISADMERELPAMDIVYINAIAWVGDTYEEHGLEYKLDKDSPLKSDAIILHPLARGDELSTELDDSKHNWYFAQARGAVFVRMALMSSIVRF
ncbi:MAG: aspartate carbamoyltransferase [Gammaproteobacteria bacterium]|nr:aspartate carbamoyltransferase [Gammaproteobacteria bacterium]